ncbi:C4-dicarboxylate ABC transporter permease [Labilibaculum filiforme]|uniref:C4-dicarboxylate ABC transporter permease n=1 Tax=Labilibaculum filiforme TaxID=1940526 RepID=A0A2N3I430_9BACT|nr:TRAP transporter small permease [Labilibaculum filiforme]PKQ65056.1 C4-dicarboxylate ABC transporter permease [Labilibaculum filiforme]
MTFKNQLDRILEKLLISLMCILVLDVLWQVLSRYILASPSSFTDELAGFLLIWVGLLGAAYVAGQKQHLAIDLLLQKSAPAKQKHLLRFINVCIALFALGVMIIGGSWLVITRFQFEVSSAALQIPLGYIYLVLPLSGLITLYYSIVFIVEPSEELK